jgi:lipopolysaccharide/colanic/teichoic acid biosynthesis glycosyltransferase
MSSNVLGRGFHEFVSYAPPPKLQREHLLTALNVFIAAVLLVLLSPLMVLVWTAVFVQDGGPPLFGHRRIGQRGRSFQCLKFRTMATDADQRLAQLLANDPEALREWSQDQKLRHDPRITPLGAILRKSSLDELPQLVNVVRGEMSLVGPRPIVAAEARRYGRRIHYYYAVKPGITGLWQVSGRNDVSYRRRVAMDCLYARKRNLLFDGWLLILTIPAVLVRRGCY